ncbi:MAG: MFS transporter [Acidobacteria bacterium]|nr:MFS transporter [Acidobacteriota bacterium]
MATEEGRIEAKIENTPESSGGLSKKGWKVSIFVLAMTSLVTAIDLTIISVALPTVEQDLNLSPSAGQWVVNAYLLSFTILLIPGGMFGDRIGQIKGLNLGLVIFSIGSLMCGIAGDEKLIIAGRAVQGLGAAILMPCIQALVTRVAPEGKKGSAFGIYAAVSSVGLAVGPLLGGFLVDSVGWRWIFFINPIILLPLIVLVRMFLRTAGEGVSKKKRLITWEMLKRPSLRSGLWLIFWVRLPLIWIFIYAGIYFQSVIGLNAFQTGLAMIPGIVGIAIGGVVAGRLKDKMGWRMPTVLGFLGVAGCLIVLGFALPAESYVLILVPMFVLGIAVNFATTPVNVQAITDADEMERGMISGTMTVSTQAGNTLGSMVLGAITNSLVLAGITATAGYSATQIYDQIQHPSDSSSLPQAALQEGQKAFADGMATTAFIGAGIIILALFLAWAMRMFKDPGTPPQKAEPAKSGGGPEPAAA